LIARGKGDRRELSHPFEFEGAAVRVMKIDGEPWFVAMDVCAVLGISAYRDALSRLDEDERGSVMLDTLGGAQAVAAINESGLYSLVLRSRKPEAKRFKKWVTGTVLPAIRKDGAYVMGEEKVASGELEETQAGSTAARNSWCSPPPARRQEQARQHQRGSGPALPWPAGPTRHDGTEVTTSANPAPPARARITHRARPPAADAIQEQQAGSTAARNSWWELRRTRDQPGADAPSPTALPWLANPDAPAREGEAATT